jgi:LysM repeat protein
MIGGGALVVLLGLGFALFGQGWGGPSEAKGEPVALSGADPLLSGPLPSTNREPPALVINQSSGRTSGDQGRPGTQPVTGTNQPGRTTEAATRTTGTPTTTSPRIEAERARDGSALTPPPLAGNRGLLGEALENAGGITPVTGSANSASSQRESTAGTTTDRPAATKNDAPARAIRIHLDAADGLTARNDRLAARQALWDAMRTPGLDELELSVLRGRLTELNKDLVFGTTILPGDPLTESYTVKAGDALARIARSKNLSTHWKLIQRVNGLASPDRIRVGQNLKLVRGPFHAVVDKSDFRLDLYAGSTSDPDGWVFIRSFDVGLGEGDSTPIGHFIVRPSSKLENPGWVNPRNPSERYEPNDPRNPIGEFWIGLDGLGDASAYTGYGIHGTIEPDSIGRMRSMGCVRLRADDIALLYELLTEGESLVQIRR